MELTPRIFINKSPRHVTISSRVAVVSFVFAALLCVLPVSNAQEEEEPQRYEMPEEIVVVGERRNFQLRLEMWDAEAKAYGIFNQYNDDQRFDISCRQHQPTGTRISRQVCTPAFQLEASKNHAQDYINGTSQFVPMHMAIASQLKEYREKMKQIAEEHPEFLEAVIRYSEVRERYEAATKDGE